jgi:integrase
MIKKELFFVAEFEKFIAALSSGRRLTPAGKRLSEGTVTNYRFTLKLLIEFENFQQTKIRLNVLTRASLKTLQTEKKYWMKFQYNFCNFLYKTKGYYDIYVTSNFKNIKAFFNYLSIDKALPIGQYHKLFKIPQQQFTPVVITPQQFNYLITNKEFIEKLSPPLKRVRDIFIVGCTVGLRIGDLMQLKKTNLIKTQEETFLLIHTQKTGTEVKIPLPEYVLEILKKYQKSNSKFILPQLANSNINIQVKRLAEKAGWTHTLPKYISSRGRVVEKLTNKKKSYRFCDHITAHTMRRTAITTLLILGVPELVVRKISGHAIGSKEFYKYISIANDYGNNQITEAYKKLVSMNTFSSPHSIRLL